MIAQAAGGPISVTGEPDRPPVKPGLSFGDTGTGMLMAATILGALHERNRTGQGRRLQVAMQDAMVHYMRTCFATMARTGRAARRNGAKSGGGNNAPSGLYPAKGGGPNDYVYLTTSRANPEHWSRLMKLIGREELIDDPRFATGDVRVKNEKELDAIIGEWTRQHDKREAMEKLIAVGVPSGAVFDTMELQNEPSFEERGIMQTVHHHNGDYKMATWPVRVDGKTRAAKRIAGARGRQRRGSAQLARHRRGRGRGAAPGRHPLTVTNRPPVSITRGPRFLAAAVFAVMYRKKTANGRGPLRKSSLFRKGVGQITADNRITASFG